MAGGEARCSLIVYGLRYCLVANGKANADFGLSCRVKIKIEKVASLVSREKVDGSLRFILVE